MHACINIKGEFYTPDELYGLGLASFGEDVRISKQVVITHPELVNIGNHVAIDPYVYISTKLDIGDYVHIASFVGIGGTRESVCKLHDFSMVAQGCKLICGGDTVSGDVLVGPVLPLKYRRLRHGSIILERFAILGVGVIVLSNVTIHEGTLVGAHSLVTHDIQAWQICYGIPVRRIKDRPKETILKYAEELQNHGKA